MMQNGIFNTLARLEKIVVIVCNYSNEIVILGLNCIMFIVDFVKEVWSNRVL